MTYTQALAYIGSRLRFGSMPGLERISLLLERLGRPQDKLRFVHVAGTNGKGSVCTMTSCIAKAAGYRTGLYVSPYVTEFCERMQINNRMISHAKLAALTAEVKPLVEQMEEQGQIITEFELNTAIALLWFAREKCDLVVMEVGLGGLYDATNILEAPLVTAITSISYDHMTVLGHTLTEIAMNKCGIMKSGRPAVIYPLQEAEAMAVIRSEAARKKVPLILPDTGAVSFSVSGFSGYYVTYGGYAYHLSLMGEHQVYNSMMVVEIVKQLQDEGYRISDDHLQQGMKTAAIPARFEILSDHPLIIAEGGHNPSCGEVIGNAVQTYLAGRKIIGITGMLAEKDIENTMKNILPHLSHVITLTPEGHRALPAEELALRIAGFGKPVEAGSSYYAALKHATCLAGPDGVVLIFGSFYLAGRMRKETKKYLKAQH